MSAWAANGPKGEPFCTRRSCRRGSSYNRTPHGWFDGVVFTDWFKNVFLKHANLIPGKKALIGDNLSSHFTDQVLKLAAENDIAFIRSPPNSTHLTQPLNVAFFRPVKIQWRKVLEAYKLQNKRSVSIDKPAFPGLLCQVFDDEKMKQKAPENLKSGFAKTGIFLFDPDRVISGIPSTV